MRSSPGTQPTGIVILVTLGVIFGVFALMNGLAVFGFGAFVTTSAGFLGGLFAFTGVLVLVVGVFQIVIAYGAWLLRGWAWTLGVPVAIASVVINVLWVVAGAALGSGLVGILAALAVLYCLDAPAVRAALGRHSPSVLTAVIRRPAESPAKSGGHVIRRPISHSQDN